MASTAQPGYSRFAVDDYARSRREYRPHQVKILFIAESPPSSGGYFYFSKSIGKDHLFREMMKALGLWPQSQTMRRGIDKRPLLRRFCFRGFYLIDTCQSSVDKLPARERRDAILRGALRMPSRVRLLNPARIIVIKKTVYQPVRDALVHAGLGNKILNKAPLYFPSHGNQAKFRKRMKYLLDSTNQRASAQ